MGNTCDTSQKHFKLWCLKTINCVYVCVCVFLSTFNYKCPTRCRKGLGMVVMPELHLLGSFRLTSFFTNPLHHLAFRGARLLLGSG